MRAAVRELCVCWRGAGGGQPEPGGPRCPPPLTLALRPQALGCILYLLCFGQHPFEDGAKLRIVNGKYCIPADDTRYSVFHGLIRKSCVQGLGGTPGDVRPVAASLCVGFSCPSAVGVTCSKRWLLLLSVLWPRSLLESVTRPSVAPSPPRGQGWGLGAWDPERLPSAGATLKVNPEERLSITELVNQLQEIAAARSVNPKSPITEVGLPGAAQSGVSEARPL